VGRLGGRGCLAGLPLLLALLELGLEDVQGARVLLLRDQLRQAGIAADRILTCGLSTLAHPDVFDSFRSAGERAGRMAALIWLSA